MSIMAVTGGRAMLRGLSDHCPACPNLLIGGYNIDKGLEWLLWGLVIGGGGGPHVEYMNYPCRVEFKKCSCHHA